MLRYYRILVARIWLIVGCTILGGAAAVVYVKVAPKRYQAQAVLQVQPSSPNDAVLSTLPVLHQTGNPTGDVLTAASLVTTQPVASAVLHQLGLKESPDDALAAVQASPIGQAGLVAVQATASSPKLAQQLANAFVQQTVALRTTSMHSAIAASLPTLKSQLVQIAPSQRFGPGTLGQQLDQLEQLLRQNDPTLSSAAAATLPTSPSSPKTKLTIAAGLFAGLLLGIGAAFALHALDPRLRREEQLRELFGVPVLARIPRERKRQSRLPMLPGELSLGALEGYRTLRTLLATRASGGSRAILVTGSSPAEGKTTTAINLALALAQGGARVILIEADLRRPTIRDTLNLAPEWGTEHVLIGEVKLGEALTSTKIGGKPLQVLAVTRPDAALADRLSYMIADSLITSAKELAEFVVIDSPPLTAVVDAMPLARLADDVLVTARIGVSRLSDLSELNDMLREQGSEPTGLVLVGEASTRQGGYYYEGTSPPAGLQRGIELRQAVPDGVGTQSE
jgi:capsular exopolysaccharide synthesis family protein